MLFKNVIVVYSENRKNAIDKSTHLLNATAGISMDLKGLIVFFNSKSDISHQCS
jgi:hypothetical protein